MGKRISRRQLKEDEVLTQFERAYLFAVDHKKEFASGAAAVVVVAIAVVIALGFREQRANAASHALSQAIETFHAPVVGETNPSRPPSPTAKTYPSEADKLRESLATFEKIQKDYAGAPAARVATYYAALCHIGLGDAEKAAQALDDLKDDGNVALAGLARLTLASLARGRKEYKLATDLLADARYSYPPDAALFMRGLTLEDQGARSEAAKTYRQILDIKDPPSPWSMDAKSRLEAMGESTKPTPAAGAKEAVKP